MSCLPCVCISNARVGICESNSETTSKSEGTTTSASQTQVSSTAVKLDIHSDMASTSSMKPTNIVYELDPKCYQLITPIGIGYDGSSTVYTARHLTSGTTVVVRKTNLEAVKGCFAELRHEYYLYKLAKHECILSFHVAFAFDNELWVIMPLMEQGSTRDMLDYCFPDGFSEIVISHILRDVLQALDYIHKMGYIHRSIDASHILVSRSGQVCISGLRTSVSMIEDGRKLPAVHSFPAQAVKMLPWLAPEVLEQNVLGYDAKSDVYSVGITACELANGCVPFSDMVPMKMLLEKLNGTTPKLLDRTTLGEEIQQEQGVTDTSSSPVDSGMGDSGSPGTSDQHNPYTRVFSPEFHNFVEVCLKRDPFDRPSADKLLQHPFFKQTRRKTSEALQPLMQFVRTITETMLTKAHNNQDGEAGVSNMAERLEALQIHQSWQFE
ncbi:STE20-related kinase adapter protein alpha-like isoform X2 [Amphiura filiformis]|uniref:STE20-related kinase adapter protein alpha-like isoform X2 n=1 Tax=Amphiura filiformis TaxID=82378 RepID=UPI003B21AD06